MSIFERVLCPVNFSEFSACAFGYAQWIARRYKSTLFIQCIVEVWRHPSISFSTVEGYAEFHKFLVERGDQELKEWVKSNSTGEGHPNYVLGEYHALVAEG